MIGSSMIGAAVGSIIGFQSDHSGGALKGALVGTGAGLSFGYLTNRR